MVPIYSELTIKLTFFEVSFQIFTGIEAFLKPIFFDVLLYYIKSHITHMNCSVILNKMLHAYTSCHKSVIYNNSIFESIKYIIDMKLVDKVYLIINIWNASGFVSSLYI